MAGYAVNRGVPEIGENLEVICGIGHRDMIVYFLFTQVINPVRIGVGEVCSRVMACNTAGYYYCCVKLCAVGMACPARFVH
ncbi:Uncharacterised protein [uncultured archaeon]|nr:Uncharacterised protein [uncultured archaeon]